jgi:hypothetical protein
VEWHRKEDDDTEQTTAAVSTRRHCPFTAVDHDHAAG